MFCMQFIICIYIRTADWLIIQSLMLTKMGNENFEKSDKKALKEKHTLEN